MILFYILTIYSASKWQLSQNVWSNSRCFEKLSVRLPGNTDLCCHIVSPPSLLLYVALHLQSICVNHRSWPTASCLPPPQTRSLCAFETSRRSLLPVPLSVAISGGPIKWWYIDECSNPDCCRAHGLWTRKQGKQMDIGCYAVSGVGGQMHCSNWINYALC